MNIKRNLKLLRNRANLSQREIEEYTGISYLTIFRIETGKTSEQKITIDTISKLASFFQVSIDDFIYKNLSQDDNVSPGDTERNHL